MVVVCALSFQGSLNWLHKQTPIFCPMERCGRLWESLHALSLSHLGGIGVFPSIRGNQDSTLVMSIREFQHRPSPRGHGKTTSSPRHCIGPSGSVRVCKSHSLVNECNLVRSERTNDRGCSCAACASPPAVVREMWVPAWARIFLLDVPIPYIPFSTSYMKASHIPIQASFNSSVPFSCFSRHQLLQFFISK